ncbi:MAG: hypothetical protein HGA53_07330 [Anaerolineaceae bacterium]|nr:hypothetical protein [Anaerolineaceae bacterium]
MRANLKFYTILFAAVIGLVLVFLLSPQDKTLGSGTALVLLHGAWVWTGLFAFFAAALLGLSGIVSGNSRIHQLSKSSGVTALIFWLTYLPMSLLVMKANWSGLFFAEPRWKIPFAFAIIALLLQSGLAIINKPAVTSGGNLVYGISLFYLLSRAETILHPDSPVFSGSKNIQQIFILNLVLCLILAILACSWLYRRFSKARIPS